MKPNYPLLKKTMNIQLRKVKYLTTLAFILMCMIIYAPKASAQLSIVDVSISLAANPAGQFVGTCNLVISDTLDCDLVAVELSDATVDSVMFYREFQYDQTTGMPSGISWNRSENHIILGLGSLSNMLNWKARVSLKDAQGSWTTWEEFLFN